MFGKLPNVQKYGVGSRLKIEIRLQSPVFRV